jgi:hypothetical protein
LQPIGQITNDLEVASADCRWPLVSISFLRSVCTLSFMFLALLLWSADRADAHVMHGMAKVSMASAEGAVSGNPELGTASKVVSGGSWADCDRDCCSDAHCSSTLIATSQVAELLFDPQRLAVVPLPLMTVSARPEGLRRPPKRFI